MTVLIALPFDVLRLKVGIVFFAQTIAEGSLGHIPVFEDLGRFGNMAALAAGDLAITRQKADICNCLHNRAKKFYTLEFECRIKGR